MQLSVEDELYKEMTVTSRNPHLLAVWRIFLCLFYFEPDPLYI